MRPHLYRRLRLRWLRARQAQIVLLIDHLGRDTRPATPALICLMLQQVELAQRIHELQAQA